MMSPLIAILAFKCKYCYPFFINPINNNVPLKSLNTNEDIAEPVYKAIGKSRIAVLSDAFINNAIFAVDGFIFLYLFSSQKKKKYKDWYCIIIYIKI